VQMCAAAEIEDAFRTIKLAARDARAELDRSFLRGILVAIAYMGPVDGRLPSKRTLQQLKTLDGLFDLVVVVSDSDSRGRRYGTEGVLGLITTFVDCLLQSRAAREFLFEVAVRRDPRNRRITFGLASLDVSRESLRSAAYAHLTRALFGVLFPPEEEDSSPEKPTMDPEYLSARHRRSGGALGPVVSALSPLESQLASEWTRARSQELVEHTAGVLRAHAEGWLRKILKILVRAMVCSVRYLRRVRRPELRDCESGRITREKARVFEQLFRIKQIELAMLPTAHVRCATPSCPFVLSLTDVAAGRAELVERLPDAKKLAWEVAQKVSLEDLLSGRVSPTELCAKVDSLWKEQQVDDRIRDLLDSDEFMRMLGLVAAKIAPLFPSVDDASAKLLLAPRNAARTTALEGYTTAVGVPGQYFLLVATDLADSSRPARRRRPRHA